MATYVIGDIHGCYQTFQKLLTKIVFNSKKDWLWFVGDVVNRGPQSLAMLRWLKNHQDCIKLVLGNHDLHLLAVAAGFAPLQRKDTLQPILDADDGYALCHWLRQQPLAHHENGWLMIHAGILPQWDIPTTLTLAKEVETVIQSENWCWLAAHLYGDSPKKWCDSLTSFDRWRVIINALTRLRVCRADGLMDLKFSGVSTDATNGYQPWFEWRQKDKTLNSPRLLFGHWAALGFVVGKHYIAMDSGCLWHRQLTAFCLNTQKVVQIQRQEKGDP